MSGSKLDDPFPQLPRRGLFASTSETVSRAVDALKAISASIPHAPQPGEIRKLSYRAGDIKVETVSQEEFYKHCEDIELNKPNATDFIELEKLLEAPTQTAQIETIKRKVGRPKSPNSYPGPECGVSRAAWFRQRKDAPK